MQKITRFDQLTQEVAALKNGTGNPVPASRRISINGVEQDLTADRSWSIASGTNASALSTGTVPDARLSPKITLNRTIAELRAESSTSVFIRYFISDPGKEGFFYYDAADTTSSDNMGTVLVSGTKRFKRMFSGAVNINWFPLTDAGLDSAISFCTTKKISTIYFPSTVPVYNFSATHTITAEGLTFLGDQGSPLGIKSVGTQLFYNGTGVFLQTATDDGYPEDQQLFNGTSGFTVKNISIAATNTVKTQIPGVTPYGSSDYVYVSGSKAIMDRRGGSLILENVYFQNFEQAVWGYNSDFNRFKNVFFTACLTALHLRAHSDQGSYDSLHFLGCLRAIELIGCTGVHFRDTQIISCGSSSVNPVLIATSTNVADVTGGNFNPNVGNVFFTNTWAEQNGAPGGSQIIDALFEIAYSTAGVGTMKSVVIKGVDIYFPYGSANGSVDDRRVNYLVKVSGPLQNLRIEDIAPAYQCTKGIVLITGDASPTVNASGGDVYDSKFTLTNTGTGKPVIIRQGRRASGRAMMDGVNGRFSVINQNSASDWKKLMTVTIPAAGAFTGMPVMITIIDARGQWQINSGFAKPLTFWLSLVKNNGSSDVNLATIYGDNADYIRVAKLQDGSSSVPAIFEVQTRGVTNFQDTRIEVTEISGFTNAIIFEPLLPAATSSGVLATYTPSPYPGTAGNQMTTTQRNALTGLVEGMEIYNTTTHVKEYYNGSAWKTITAT